MTGLHFLSKERFSGNPAVASISCILKKTWQKQLIPIPGNANHFPGQNCQNLFFRAGIYMAGAA